MADAILTLRLNPNTGERTLVISYESAPDVMSFEHEDDHRDFVERLLGHPLEAIADRIEIKRTPPHPLIIADRNSEQAEDGSKGLKTSQH